MRLFCLFFVVFLAPLSVAHGAEADCWEKTGQAALDACSHIINAQQIAGQARNNHTVAKAYFHRGNVYYLKRNYDRAIVNYDNAIRLNPNYLKAYHIRGNAYFLLGAYNKALADFDQVLQLDPSYKAVTFYRQQVQKKLQQQKK